jgi:F0F1-type ATP synthase beta subunit
VPADDYRPGTGDDLRAPDATTNLSRAIRADLPAVDPLASTRAF